MGLSLVAVFLYSGSMSTSEIVAAQQRPAGTSSCCRCRSCVYVVSMVGETNRAPFDLAEAEGELVGGFHTEYSLAEVRAVLPRRVHQHGHRLGAGHHAVPRRLARPLADRGHLGRREPRLVADALVRRQARGCFMFFFVWLRGSLPRVRYDQFMGSAGSSSSRSPWSGWCWSPPSARCATRTATSRRSLLVHRRRHRWSLLLVSLRRSTCSGTARTRRAEGATARRRPERDRPASPAATPCRRCPASRLQPVPRRPSRSAAPNWRRRAPDARTTTRATEQHGGPAMPELLGPVAGFGVTFRPCSASGRPSSTPRQAADRAALPRPPPAQPAPRRPGEVRRLRAVRLGLPGRRDLRRGRATTPRTERYSPGRALRPRLPDQLPALHLLRPVHRGLPDPRADDDQRVRAGRPHPRGADLREGAAAGPAAEGMLAGAAPDGRGMDGARLLPGRGHRGHARHSAWVDGTRPSSPTRRRPRPRRRRPTAASARRERRRRHAPSAARHARRTSTARRSCSGSSAPIAVLGALGTALRQEGRARALSRGRRR